MSLEETVIGIALAVGSVMYLLFLIGFKYGYKINERDWYYWKFERKQAIIELHRRKNNNEITYEEFDNLRNEIEIKYSKESSKALHSFQKVDEK